MIWLGAEKGRPFLSEHGPDFRQAGHDLAQRLVLQADVAVVPGPVIASKIPLIVELTGPRLMAARNVRHMDVPDARDVLGQVPDEFPSVIAGGRCRTAS